MGFAFIEFKYKDVAKVAADAMNGYMFYGKKLVCRVIEDDQGMRVHTKKFKFIPFNKKFIEQKNAVIIFYWIVFVLTCDIAKGTCSS